MKDKTQVFYRKFRPQQLADVVGQEHVTRTLLNALAAGHTWTDSRSGKAHIFRRAVVPFSSNGIAVNVSPDRR